MNINDYKDVNGNVLVSETLVSDLIGGINGIVESGSNANGNWVKFADGTVLQEGTVDIPLANSRGSISVALPTPLINTNGNISCNVRGVNGNNSLEADACVANARQYNTSAFNIHASYLRSVGQTYTLNISYFVIGRWK